MRYTSPFIYVSELIQLKTRLANQTCNTPWKNGLGLSGSVRDSFINIHSILNGFLIKDFSDSERLKNELNECSKYSGCRFYAVLDKERENSMSICVEVHNSFSCHVLTCTCQKRQKRGIDHQVTDHNEDKLTLEKAKCDIKRERGNLCPKDNTYEITTKKRVFVQTREQTIKHVTTLKDSFKKEADKKDKDLEENPWISFLIFLIGTLIGTLIGSIVTYFYLKRKASQATKSISVLNSIYFKKEESGYEHRQQEVTEYSEIPERPEHFDENRPQMTDENRKLDLKIEYADTVHSVNNQGSSYVLGVDISSQDTTKDNAVVTIETDSKYHCIEGIASQNTTPASLKDDGHITPQQPTAFENGVDTDALYFKLDKQQATSILTEDRPENEDDYLKIHSSDIIARNDYPAQKETSLSLEYDDAKESLYVEPFLRSNATTNNQEAPLSMENTS